MENNSIEEKFYKVFEIKYRVYSKCTSDYCISADKPYSTICKKCPYYAAYKLDYPPITDRILLELEQVILSTKLMLLLKSSINKFEYIVYEKYKEIGFCERETRKDALLQLCINIQNGYTSNNQEISYKKDIKQDVKALFESEVE